MLDSYENYVFKVLDFLSENKGEKSASVFYENARDVFCNQFDQEEQVNDLLSLPRLFSCGNYITWLLRYKCARAERNRQFDLLRHLFELTAVANWDFIFKHQIHFMIQCAQFPIKYNIKT